VRRKFFPRLLPFPRRSCPDSRLELMQNLLSGLGDLSILISPKLGCFHRCTVHEFLNCHLLEQLQYCYFGHIPAGAHRTCPLQFTPMQMEDILAPTSLDAVSYRQGNQSPEMHAIFDPHPPSK
jgi:hypothetical protein